MTYFFFSNLWLTRMADPKAPRPTCSMISYCSILDSIDSPEFNSQTSLFCQQMGENEAMPESLKWITWLFLSQCHHCKPNPSELRLPHFVKKFRNFDDNYLQTTDEVMAVPPSTPLTSLSIMWVAPTKLIVVSYCGCLASSWNEDMFHYRPCSCKRTEGACTHIENSETSPNFSTRIQISRLPDTVILL